MQTDTFADAARLKTGVRQITSLLFTNVASTSTLPKLHLNSALNSKLVQNNPTRALPSLTPYKGYNYIVIIDSQNVKLKFVCAKSTPLVEIANDFSPGLEDVVKNIVVMFDIDKVMPN